MKSTTQERFYISIRISQEINSAVYVNHRQSWQIKISHDFSSGLKDTPLVPFPFEVVRFHLTIYGGSAGKIRFSYAKTSEISRKTRDMQMKTSQKVKDREKSNSSSSHITACRIESGGKFPGHLFLYFEEISKDTSQSVNFPFSCGKFSAND